MKRSDEAWAARKVERGDGRACNPETEFRRGFAARDAEVSKLAGQADGWARVSASYAADLKAARAAIDSAAAKAEAHPTDPIICICGSTRFRAEMTEANRSLTMQGHIVLAPGVFGHDGDPLTDAEKVSLDRLHFEKIDLADRVYVVNPGNYIGESTRREIDYARSIDKPVSYSFNPEATQ